MSGRSKKKFTLVPKTPEKSMPEEPDEPTVLHVIKLDQTKAHESSVKEINSDFVCEKCNKHLGSKSALFFHFQEHLICCEICGDTFAGFEDYYQHCSEHRSPSSEKPQEINCPEDLWQILQDGASFSLFNREEEPSRNLTWVSVGNSNPMCRKCNIQFSSKRALNLHYISHSQDHPISCKTCGETFIRSDDFIENCSNHCKIQQLSTKGYPIKQRNLDRSQILFKCDHCPKAFCNQGNLNRHKMIHSGARNYLCDICHEAFTERIALQKHFLIHAEIKPYVCEMCEKTFSSKVMLNTHRQMHNDEKMARFTCFICGCEVTGKRNFKRHSLEHLPGQISSCHICGKAFPTKRKLQLHVLIHSDDSSKPFKCGICDRGFTYGSHLKRHQLSHTGERPFACGLCGETFIAKYSLTYHLNKHKRERQSRGSTS